MLRILERCADGLGHLKLFGPLLVAGKALGDKSAGAEDIIDGQSHDRATARVAGSLYCSGFFIFSTNFLVNMIVAREIITMRTVARMVINVRPRTIVECMAETILSFASVSIASMTAPAVGQMLKEWIEELWPKVFPDKPIPEEAKKLTEYVPSPETLKTLALQGYTTAISNYDGAAQALGRGEQKYRWFYQGQQAAACLGHWQLQPDPNQLKRAEDILKAALKDKEASPYLRPIVRLRDMLKTGRSPEEKPVPEEPATAPADTNS